MATYVNNLRLTELATGEGSGTWGTTTNTNLELIGEALGYGSEAIANASTHTITVADGTADSARSFYLKLTGGGQACTVTLAPNTLSKVWMVENTTNSTLTFSQGSGANVAVPAGQVKMIATDGAGSGAVVYDLLVDTDLTGTTTVVNLTSSGTIDAATVEFNSLSGTGSVAITDILDQDNMSSDSATALATQQSIKAYVDSSVASFDTLAEVLAQGNTTGSTDIEVTTAQKVQFRDSAIYINSSADGQLDIVADTEIQIAATTIDINGAINASGEIIAASLDISGNIDVDGVTNLDVVDIDGAVDMASTLAVGGNITQGNGDYLYTGGGNFDIKHTIAGQNIVFSTTPSGGSTAETLRITSDGKLSKITGDLTLDVAGNIILDADGGEIPLKDGGTEFGNIYKSSSNLVVQSSISDGDLLLKGNDGGSVITALTLDMSDEGAAIFNGHGTFNDTVAINSTSSGALLIAGSGGGINFTGGNNRVLFNSNRALEGTTDGATLTVGEGFTTINIDGAATFSSTIAATSATFTNADNSANLTLVSTDTDASSGPVLDMWRNSANPADGDAIGEINYYGENDAGEQTKFANIISTMVDVSDGTEDGGLYIQNMVAGTMRERISMLATETIVNNNSIDLDFRVESDAQTHALFLNGENARLGLSQSNPTYSVHVGDGASAERVHLESNGGGTVFSGVDSANNPNSGFRWGHLNGTDRLEGAIGTTQIIDWRSTALYFKPNATEVLGLTASAVTVNNGSADVDFRVESNNNANMLFVDGGKDTIGIGVAPLDNNLSPALQFASGGTMFGYGDAMYITGNTYYNGGWKAIATGGGANTIIDSNGFKVYNNASASADATISPLLHLTVGPSEMVVNDDSYDYDFRVESDGNANMLFVDASANRVGVGISPTETLHVNGRSRIQNLYLGEISSNLDIVQATSSAGLYLVGGSSDVTIGTAGFIFNQGGADKDFRVESDGNANMLFVDGGANKVSIGTTANSGILTVGSTLSVEGDVAPTGAGLMLGDYNSGSYKWIQSFSSQPLRLNPLGNEVSIGITGTVTTFKTFGGAVFNDDGADQDFRVESSNDTHMLFVDAGDDVVIVDGNSFSAIDNGTSNGVAIRRSGRIVTCTEANGNAIEFASRTNGKVGSINVTASATSYNTSSDARLKENIANAPSASDDIDAIQVRSFDWKADGSHQRYGMVAQELNAVAPEAVSEGETEDDMMGVDYSKLVPMLVKEIQSLRARVAQLESN